MLVLAPGPQASDCLRRLYHDVHSASNCCGSHIQYSRHLCHYRCRPMPSPVQHFDLRTELSSRLAAAEAFQWSTGAPIYNYSTRGTRIGGREAVHNRRRDAIGSEHLERVLVRNPIVSLLTFHTENTFAFRHFLDQGFNNKHLQTRTCTCTHILKRTKLKPLWLNIISDLHLFGRESSSSALNALLCVARDQRPHST